MVMERAYNMGFENGQHCRECADSPDEKPTNAQWLYTLEEDGLSPVEEEMFVHGCNDGWKGRKPSRQRMHQRLLTARGLCRICAEPATEHRGLCAVHYGRHVEVNRKAARRKAGIPENAPLQKRGPKPR